MNGDDVTIEQLNSIVRTINATFGYPEEFYTRDENLGRTVGTGAFGLDHNISGTAFVQSRMSDSGVVVIIGATDKRSLFNQLVSFLQGAQRMARIAGYKTCVAW